LRSRFQKKGLAIAFACLLQVGGAAGCGFLANLSGACDTPDCWRRSRYYRGVYMDVKFWRELNEPGLAPAQRGFGYLVTAVDFPVTAVLDTLVVPFIALSDDDSGPQRLQAPILKQLAQ